MERSLLSYQLPKPSILCGDFNSHHPWWDPRVEKSQRADDLVDWIETQDLDLLNNPGVYTFFRRHLSETRESVLDLGFASISLLDSI